MYRINEFVQHKLPNVPPMLNKGITVSEAPMNVPELNTVEITDDDKAILDEMEKE